MPQNGISHSLSLSHADTHPLWIPLSCQPNEVVSVLLYTARTAQNSLDISQITLTRVCWFFSFSHIHFILELLHGLTAG